MLSTFLFNAIAPPDPRLTGSGEADAGSFTVSGSLAGISLADARLTLPYVSGSVDSGFIRSAKGVAHDRYPARRSSWPGSLSGCTLIGLLGAVLRRCQGRGRRRQRRRHRPARHRPGGPRVGRRRDDQRPPGPDPRPRVGHGPGPGHRPVLLVLPGRRLAARRRRRPPALLRRHGHRSGQPLASGFLAGLVGGNLLSDRDGLRGSLRHGHRRPRRRRRRRHGLASTAAGGVPRARPRDVPGRLPARLLRHGQDRRRSAPPPPPAPGPAATRPDRHRRRPSPSRCGTRPTRATRPSTSLPAPPRRPPIRHAHAAVRHRSAGLGGRWTPRCTGTRRSPRQRSSGGAVTDAARQPDQLALRRAPRSS